MPIKNKLKNIIRRYVYIPVNGLLQYSRVRLVKNPSPKTLIIDPTYRCSINCISCKCPEISASFNKKNELLLSDYQRIISEFKRLKGKSVSFFGGEPLLYSGIFNVIKCSKDNNLFTSLSTNGILLNKNHAKRLLDTEINCITISINGTGTVYDKVTQKPGNFERFMKTMETFFRLNDKSEKRRIPINIHAMVMRQNLSDLTNILNVAKRFRVSKVSYQYISRVPPPADKETGEILGLTPNAQLNHWDINDDLLLKDEDMPILKEEIHKLKNRALDLDIEVILDPVLEKQDTTSITRGVFQLQKRCFLPWNDILVGVDGSLILCPMLSHYPVSNAQEISLVEYWNHNKHLINFRNILLNKKYIPICFYCALHGQRM